MIGVFSIIDDHPLNCLSVCQDADGHPVEVKVRSKGDGLYSCSYTPITPLKHTVAVAWGGVSIPKSPFRVSSQSQHPVTAGSDIPAKSGDPVQAESVNAVDLDGLFKAEHIRIVQSEPTVVEKRFEKVQSKCNDVISKAKKPLIIITTYIEERYTY